MSPIGQYDPGGLGAKCHVNSSQDPRKNRPMVSPRGIYPEGSECGPICVHCSDQFSHRRVLSCERILLPKSSRRDPLRYLFTKPHPANGMHLLCANCILGLPFCTLVLPSLVWSILQVDELRSHGAPGEEERRKEIESPVVNLLRSSSPFLLYFPLLRAPGRRDNFRRIPDQKKKG